MFLTTNRIDAFDPAFKSRIHLSIKYTQLDWNCRYRLWAGFIANSTSNEMDDAFLTKLADLEFNGRQIRNTVRTASALAASADQPLNTEHIEKTLRAISAFDKDGNDMASSAGSSEEDSAISNRRPQKRRRAD
jgi:SpoVK/Ycf46/Vps4 family AAA+-type ATPase